MTDREILLADALRRVLEVADVTAGPVDPTAIHGAVGWELITELCFAQRWIVGVNPAQAEALFEVGPETSGIEDDYRWAPTDTSVVDSYRPPNGHVPTYVVYDETHQWGASTSREASILHQIVARYDGLMRDRAAMAQAADHPALVKGRPWPDDRFTVTWGAPEPRTLEGAAEALAKFAPLDTTELEPYLAAVDAHVKELTERYLDDEVIQLHPNGWATIGRCDPPKEK